MYRFPSRAVLLAVLAMSGLGATAHAGSVELSKGTYHTTVAVEVPVFHAIAPKLGLSYDSGGDDGKLGVGWSLEGSGFIERIGKQPGIASWETGTPRHDSSDGWSLGGVELLPCSAIPSATTAATSCYAGGTWASKIEDHRKITSDSAGFTVREKDGTVGRYATALAGPTGVTYRYYLTSVSDAAGNSVSYGYTRDASGGDLYLTSISYGGNSIALAYEARPDAVPQAAGAGLITTSKRLAFIDVLSAGRRRATYALAYRRSPVTGRSLLTSVTRYGTDAALSCSTATFPVCSITNASTASKLPPLTFTHVGDDLAAQAGSFDSVAVLADTVTWGGSYTWSGDFDGDGRSDLGQLKDGALYVASFTPGGVMSSVWSSAPGPFGPAEWTWIGDFDGDGRDDIATRVNSAIYMKRGSGHGFGSGLWWDPARLGNGHWGGRVWIGDFDGDGRSDIATSNGTSSPVWVKSDSGSAVSERQFAASLLVGDTDAVRVGDFDGDGRDDLALLNATGITVYRSTGTSFVTEAWSGPLATGSCTATYTTSECLARCNNGMDSACMQACMAERTCSQPADLVAGDWNGDGCMDLAVGNNGVIKVALSTGATTASQARGFVLQDWQTTGLTWDINWLQPRDIDGDGRTDLVTRALDGSPLVYRSSGAAFLPVRNWGASGHYASTAGFQFYGDFDGDGRQEIASIDDAEKNKVWLHTSRLPASHGEPTLGLDLLRTESSLRGGVITVRYVPGSAWAQFSSSVPRARITTVKSLSVSDGRGHTAVTSYEYQSSRVKNRVLVGFLQVTETLPRLAGEAQAPTVQSTFDLDAPDLSARPTAVLTRDGQGLPVKWVLWRYAHSTTIPYRTVMTQQTSKIGDGQDGVGGLEKFSTTNATRTYDIYSGGTWRAGYGNLAAETRWSDLGNGTLRHTTTSYRYTTALAAAYMVAKPSSVSVFGDDGVTKLAETLYAYDGKGNCTQEQAWVDKLMRADGTINQGSVVPPYGGWYLTTTRAYDAFGNVIKTTSPGGAISSTAFDAAGVYPLRTTNALGKIVDLTWNTTLGVKLSESAGGELTSYTYDTLGRLTSKTAPDGGVERMIYASVGNPQTQYDEVQAPGPAGGTLLTRTYLDGLGRAVRTQLSGSDSCVSRDYDLRGNQWRQSEPYACSSSPTLFTSLQLDALGRVVKVTTPDGKVATTSYSMLLTAQNGTIYDYTYVLESTHVDPLGHKTVIDHDAEGRAIRQLDYVGTTAYQTTYQYDAFGRQTRAVDAKNNVWSTTFDSLGRVVKDSHPDRGVTRHEYDADSRESARTNALAERTELLHDALGRVTRRTTRVGLAGAASVTFSYDRVSTGHSNQGRLTGYVDALGWAKLDYDKGGRLVLMTRHMNETATDYVFKWGYDSGGRLLWKTFPDGDTMGTAAAPLRYDAAGRLASVPGVLTAVTYDLADRPLKLSFANGTSTTYSYSNQRGWVNSITTAKGTSAPVQTLSYTHDADGQVTRIDSKNAAGTQIAGEAWQYGYDAMHRLTAATDLGNSANNQTWAYDQIGNMTQSSRMGGAYTYGTAHPHAVTTAGTTPYAYDLAGQMTSGGGRGYSWNGLGLPASVVVGGVTTTYGYDALGNRLTRKVGNAAATYFFGDDYEIDRANGRVIKSLRVGKTVLGKRIGTSKYWHHVDAQGSVRLISDVNGTFTERLANRPYGEQFTPSREASYTGERQDDNGLFYLHNRYYDPKLGRFISADPTIPTQHSVGLNAYAYALDNPTNFTDQNGLGDDPWPTYSWEVGVGSWSAGGSTIKLTQHGDGASAYFTVKAGTSPDGATFGASHWSSQEYDSRYDLDVFYRATYEAASDTWTLSLAFDAGRELNIFAAMELAHTAGDVVHGEPVTAPIFHLDPALFWSGAVISAKVSTFPGSHASLTGELAQLTPRGVQVGGNNVFFTGKMGLGNYPEGAEREHHGGGAGGGGRNTPTYQGWGGTGWADYSSWSCFGCGFDSGGSTHGGRHAEVVVGDVQSISESEYYGNLGGSYQNDYTSGRYREDYFMGRSFLGGY